VTQPAQSRAFLPLGIALGGRRCLVVGGGAVGTRKAATLARSGASVTVVAPAVTEELAAQVATGRVRWIEGPFQDDHLVGAFLAVAATNDPAVNRAVTAAAERAGTLACDASSAQSSQVIFGALFEHDGTTVAVFTDGHDPTRARDMRDRIAVYFAPGRPGR